MTRLTRALLGACAVSALAVPAMAATTLTIATVNNGDMIRMQKLAEDFTAKNPDVTLEWVTLEENILRQRVTTDIATKGGQYDVVTVGNYEVPIWAKQGWLVPLDGLPADYDVEDLLPGGGGGGGAASGAAVAGRGSAGGAGAPWSSHACASASPTISPNIWLISGAVVKSPRAPKGSRVE